MPDRSSSSSSNTPEHPEPHPEPDTVTINEAINLLENRIASEARAGVESSSGFGSGSGSGYDLFKAYFLAAFRRMGHWEFAAATVTLFYGIFLIIPFDTLSVVGLVVEHNIFLRSAAEALWGVAFILVGLNQWAGAWIDWTHWRIANGVVLLLIWVGIAYLYFGAFLGSTAGFLSAWIILCSICSLATLTKILRARAPRT